MELKEVVSIAGRPGLHKIIGKRTAGVIVESLDESKKRFPASITQKVSILDDISIYTTEGDTPLLEVFINMDKEVKGGLKLITKKSTKDEIHNFFEKVLPDYDKDQVYNSDILKLATWYNILKDHMEFKKVEKEAEESEGKKATKKESKAKPKTASAPKSAPKSKTSGAKISNTKTTPKKAG